MTHKINKKSCVESFLDKKVNYLTNKEKFLFDKLMGIFFMYFPLLFLIGIIHSMMINECRMSVFIIYNVIGIIWLFLSIMLPSIIIMREFKQLQLKKYKINI